MLVPWRVVKVNESNHLAGRSTQYQRSSYRPRYKNQVSWRFGSKNAGEWNRFFGWESRGEIPREQVGHVDVPVGFVRINGWDQWVISPTYKIGIFLGVEKTHWSDHLWSQHFQRDVQARGELGGMGSQDEVSFSITMVNVYKSPKDRRATFWTP